MPAAVTSVTGVRPTVRRRLIAVGVLIAASVSSMELSRISTSTRALSGPILGAEGRIAFKRFEVRGRYLEGTLMPEAGAFGGPEDLADLRLLFGADVGAGITVGLGPHLRAFISPGGTEFLEGLEIGLRLRRP
jgi:hypothetical protein